MKDDRFTTTLDILKVTMSVLVITIHFALPCHDTTYHSMQLYVRTVICGVAVPTFFCISGFLFFKKIEEWNWDIYSQKVKRRVYSLLIPYVCWNLLSLFFITLVRLKSGGGIIDAAHDLGYLHIFWDSNRRSSSGVGILGPMLPYVFPLVEPLWYLRELMVMVIFSPVFYLLISKGGRMFLGLLLVGYLFSIANVYPIWSGSAWCFFGLGAYLSIKTKQLYTDSNMVLLITTVLAITLAVCLGIMNTGNLWFIHILALYKIVAVIVVLALAYKFSAILRMPKILANSTMFVYCFHSFMLGLIVNPLIKYIDDWDNVLFSTITFFVAPSVIMCVCALIHAVYKSLIYRLFDNKK